MCTAAAAAAAAAAAEVAGGGGCRADSDSDGESGERAPKRKPAKRQKRAADSDDDGGSSKRKGTGFAKPLPLSAELAAACGKSEMNRGEICKWLYAYCNEHNLKVRGVLCVCFLEGRAKAAVGAWLAA